jgi:hypothetical protein
MMNQPPPNAMKPIAMVLNACRKMKLELPYPIIRMKETARILAAAFGA